MKRDFSRKRAARPIPIPGLTPTKSALRQHMLQRLRALEPETRLTASLLICQNTAQWPGFQQARTVSLFASRRTEPDTRLLREEAWAQKSGWSCPAPGRKVG